MLVPTRRIDIDYRSAGFWEDRTLSSYLDEAGTRHPDVTAIAAGTHRTRYREMRGAAASLAHALSRRWVRPRDVVTVFLPNWPESALAIHAITWSGCVVSPVVTTYRRAELSFILTQSGSRAIFIPHVFRDFNFVTLLSEVIADMDDPPAVIVVRPQGDLPEGFFALDDLLDQHGTMDPAGDPADICLLLYTSGTTSAPKGVLHSHQTIIWEMRSIIRELQLSSDDSTFMASPIGHLTGIVYGVYLPTVLANTAALLDVWDAPAAADIIDQHACRVSLGATPFLQGLTTEYERRGTCSSLHTFICGGADVPADLVARGSRVLGARVTRTYGLSEMPTFSISGADAAPEQCAHTDGTPIEPADGYLLNESDGVGELVVRGPELFLGYLDAALNEDAFTDDGYFRTGDLVSIDPAGALSVRGRMKDIIIRGGENISALEVEEVLLTMPGVVEAVVVAAPDDRLGERTAAVLRVRDGHPMPTIDDVRDHFKQAGIARQKWPEELHQVDD
ncbi:MAG TPA: AMP-binding protein, partial [Mycobacterium sp.]|nr:AMP-binding protein [Mycobacterium sp.]